jgi:hypothetical protein
MTYMTTDATKATETAMVTKTIRITISDQDWLDLRLRAAGMDTSVSAEASKAIIEHLGHQQTKTPAKRAKRASLPVHAGHQGGCPQVDDGRAEVLALDGCPPRTLYVPNTPQHVCSNVSALATLGDERTEDRRDQRSADRTRYDPPDVNGHGASSAEQYRRANGA